MTVLVVGAGVVGLATARALALGGREVVVAEAAEAVGTGVSSRNSEVIHAGLYYPAGSLRARHCVAGRRLLYAYCEAHGVPHARPGKLVVATSADELATIEALHARGTDNGVEGLELVGAGAAMAMEPALACAGALLSRETGIVDSHALMQALLGDLEAAGGAVALGTPVEGVTRDGTGWTAHFGGREPGALPCEALVNCAGLGAQALAARIEGYPADRVPRRVLAKGSYFGFAGRPAFTRLIYPAPVEGGLGTHLTLDLAGRMRFGPDVEWIEDEDYTVNPARARRFEEAVRRYWPGLPQGSLVPDYAGIRPKLSGPGEPAADFLIDGPAEHGLPGLVQLFGIESPGLTSSLSLAEDVARRLEG
ncbi:NAD(P)/FAD-dependent oxidoreductase [Methylobacterium sp. sgz302541]|uniref:NAD(P)/FAD-dependent oxidoreductase n=1 Tax=unclassified Methylobacterium TaxID=2615210 RepID=UPI003D329F17